MATEERRYTSQHEWLVESTDDTVRIGITDYAQESLGDIVFVSLPQVGQEFAAGDIIGEVESTKSVSEIYAPLAGTVTARNDAVETAPETINAAPYGDGWLVELRPAEESDAAEFLDEAAYAALIAR